MELFGVSIETIYLYTLMISGAITILYLFFSDFLSGLLEGFINPTLIFAFIATFSAAGFVIERLASLHSILIAVVAALIALILVTLLNVFVLVPLSSAEESLVYKESDLRGRIGKVITTIPVDGYGEVLIDSVSGRIAKPAFSFNKQAIPNGKKVLVIDVVDGVLEVGLYEELEKLI